MIMMQQTVIEKEQIPDFKIVPAFVDKSEHWKNELEYAVRLGNEFKGKASITFETTQGPRTVNTTVWSVMADFMQLKGGLNIPLKSIIQVSF